MDILAKLSEELSIKQTQIEAAVGLLDEGNTIPFIARYRKEVTGSLDDEQLRALSERLNYLRGLEKRKEEVGNAITEQGKMTDEIRIGLTLENVGLYEDMTLKQNLKYYSKISGKIDCEEINQVVERVGLTESMNTKFDKYSLI